MDLEALRREARRGRGVGQPQSEGPAGAVGRGLGAGGDTVPPFQGSLCPGPLVAGSPVETGIPGSLLGWRCD